MDRQELEALIARTALGDRDAFSRLYDNTSGKLFAVCVRVLGDKAAAEDAMQDTYIKVWTSAGKYRANGHSPMTWLITIARNTAIDRLRLSHPGQTFEALPENLIGDEISPEAAAIARSETRRILDCLDELDTARRDALTGAYLSGETYQDLSDRLDVPLNTIRTWLRRGIASLRECLSR